MIKQFNDVPIRDSGVIYNSVFQQIKLMHAQDPVKAGELAMAAIELILTGQTSSDDYMIEIALQPLIVIRNRNENDYNAKQEASKLKRMEDNRLKEIAQLYLEGMTQAQIGAKIGVSQQIISNRLRIIRKDYPELLQIDTNTYKDTNSTTFVKDCTPVKNCEVVNDSKIEEKVEVKPQFIF